MSGSPQETTAPTPQNSEPAYHANAGGGHVQYHQVQHQQLPRPLPTTRAPHTTQQPQLPPPHAIRPLPRGAVPSAYPILDHPPPALADQPRILGCVTPLPRRMIYDQGVTHHAWPPSYMMQNVPPPSSLFALEEVQGQTAGMPTGVKPPRICQEPPALVATPLSSSASTPTPQPPFKKRRLSNGAEAHIKLEFQDHPRLPIRPVMVKAPQDVKVKLEDPHPLPTPLAKTDLKMKRRGRKRCRRTLDASRERPWPPQKWQPGDRRGDFYLCKRGDTWASMAEMFDMTRAELLQCNATERRPAKVLLELEATGKLVKRRIQLVERKYRHITPTNSGKWQAQFCLGRQLGRYYGKKMLNLGSYITQEKAALAYNRKAKELGKPLIKLME